jgi:organic radical activating enzyme
MTNNSSLFKVSELFFFFSIQGEGRYTGVPSVFLRTFGCNFRCLGFGMPKGELTKEIEQVDEKAYTSYTDLPLLETGCDSYSSSDPRFKHLSPSRDIDTVVSDIMELLPHKEWKEEHLVITGGEPLLGWQRAYPKLLSHPSMRGLKEITFETNGTQPLTKEFSEYLDKWMWHEDYDWEGYHPGFEREVTFSVSPKLSCSGEKAEAAIKPEIVAGYQKAGHVYLKFVIATEEDANEALAAVEQYRGAGFMGSVYFMPVGGVESVYALNNRTVAELAMKNGVRYSDRLHLPLFGNRWGT